MTSSVSDPQSELLAASISKKKEPKGEAQDHGAAEGCGRIGESEHREEVLRFGGVGGGAIARTGVAPRGTARDVPSGHVKKVIIRSSS